MSRLAVLGLVATFAACASVEGYEADGDEAEFFDVEDAGVLEEKALPSASYQAESRTAQSGCSLDTKHSGYTGSSFVDFGGNGTWIEWNNVSAPLAGRYELRFRYANADAGSRAATILLNGRSAGTVAFAGTGGWTRWSTASMSVSLVRGNNTVRVLASTGAGGPNLDRVDVVATDLCPSDSTKVEPGECGCGVPEGSCGGGAGFEGNIGPCTNPSTRPVDEKRWASRDSRYGDALFVFYDYDKSSRQHVVPIENNGYSRIYVVEVGSQSRDPSNTRIIRRKTSSNVTFLAGGGSTDKYQHLYAVAPNNAGRSATFNQPLGGGTCIRDEGQYVVIYTNKALRQLKATMRDPALTGNNNQYSGAPNDNAVSLIADDETNNDNRTRAGGATQRMLESASFFAFEHKDNGFFLYKKGARVPTFTGNGCDAQYEFY